MFSLEPRIDLQEKSTVQNNLLDVLSNGITRIIRIFVPTSPKGGATHRSVNVLSAWRAVARAMVSTATAKPFGTVIATLVAAIWIMLGEAPSAKLALWMFAAASALWYYSKVRPGKTRVDSDLHMLPQFVEAVAVGLILGSVTNVLYEFQVKPFVEEQAKVARGAGRNHDLSKATRDGFLWMINTNASIDSSEKERLMGGFVEWWETQMLGSAHKRNEKFSELHEENLVKFVKPVRAFENADTMRQLLTEFFKAENYKCDQSRLALIAEEFNVGFQKAFLEQIKLNPKAQVAFQLATAGLLKDAIESLSQNIRLSQQQFAYASGRPTQAGAASQILADTSLDESWGPQELAQTVASWKWAELASGGIFLDKLIDYTDKRDPVRALSTVNGSLEVSDVAAWLLAASPSGVPPDGVNDLVERAQGLHPEILSELLFRGVSPLSVRISLSKFFDNRVAQSRIDGEVTHETLRLLERIPTQRKEFIDMYGPVLVRSVEEHLRDVSPVVVPRLWKEEFFEDFNSEVLGKWAGEELAELVYLLNVPLYAYDGDRELQPSPARVRSSSNGPGAVETLETLRVSYEVSRLIRSVSKVWEEVLPMRGCHRLRARLDGHPVNRWNGYWKWKRIIGDALPRTTRELGELLEKRSLFARDLDNRLALTVLLCLEGEEERSLALWTEGEMASVQSAEALEIARLFLNQDLRREFLRRVTASAQHRYGPRSVRVCQPIERKDFLDAFDDLPPDWRAIGALDLEVVDDWKRFVDGRLEEGSAIVSKNAITRPSYDDLLGMLRILLELQIGEKAKISGPPPHDYMNSLQRSREDELVLWFRSSVRGAGPGASLMLDAVARHLVMSHGLSSVLFDDLLLNAGKSREAFVDAKDWLFWRLELARSFDPFSFSSAELARQMKGGEGKVIYNMCIDENDVIDALGACIGGARFEDAADILRAWASEPNAELFDSFHLASGLVAEARGKFGEAIGSYARVTWRVPFALLRGALLSIRFGSPATAEELLARAAKGGAPVVLGAVEEVRAVLHQRNGDESARMSCVGKSRGFYEQAGLPFLGKLQLSELGPSVIGAMEK